MLIKHKVNPSVLLASRQCAECFVLRIGRARPCFNCFNELTHERLVKAYLLQCISRPSTFSSQVRWFWTISYTNASVNRLILAELTWMRHLCFIVYNTFFTPYHAILQYITPDAFPLLYGDYMHWFSLWSSHVKFFLY